jgi:hypothetical protein
MTERTIALVRFHVILMRGRPESWTCCLRLVITDSVDAARCDTCELFEIGDDGTERVAVIGIAVQSLGMQHELPAFGRGGRRGNRDFAAKFVRCPGLAFADALPLGGVQRDLGTALTLLLMANLVGEA